MLGIGIGNPIPSELPASATDQSLMFLTLINIMFIKRGHTLVTEL